MINDTFIIDNQVVLRDVILIVVSIRAGREEHGHNGPGPNHHPHNIDDDDKEDYDNCEEHSSATSASDRQHSHEAAEADVLGRGEAAMQGRAFLRHEGQELPTVRRKDLKGSFRGGLTIIVALSFLSQEIRREHRRSGGPVGAEHLPAGHQGLPGPRRRGVGEQKEASVPLGSIFI